MLWPGGLFEPVRAWPRVEPRRGGRVEQVGRRNRSHRRRGAQELQEITSHLQIAHIVIALN